VALLWDQGRGHCFTRDFKRGEILIYQETFFNGESDIHVKKRLWQQGTLSIGAPLGNLEEDSFNGDLIDSNRALGKRSMSLYGSSVMETWRDNSFTGNYES
jgi:hypothetical protein